MDNEADTCCVCLKETNKNGSALIECAGDDCEVILHPECYGIVGKLPEKWMCMPCEEGYAGRKQIKCGICSNHSRKAAYKKSVSGVWTHVLCALWTPGVCFKDPVRLTGMSYDKVNAGAGQFQETCYICQYRGSIEKAVYGLKMPCETPGCVNKLHAFCGVRFRLLHSDDKRHWGYCEDHDPEIERRLVPSGKRVQEKADTDKEK
eukprot:Opistho-2@1529